MATQQKTEFQAWINAIPHGDYDRMRAKIIEECKISRATFASWCRGDSNPDLDKRATITVIAYNYNDESLPFKNMYISHDEEGEIQVIVRDPNQ